MPNCEISAWSEENLVTCMIFSSQECSCASYVVDFAFCAESAMRCWHTHRTHLSHCQHQVLRWQRGFPWHLRKLVRICHCRLSYVWVWGSLTSHSQAITHAKPIHTTVTDVRLVYIYVVRTHVIRWMLWARLNTFFITLLYHSTTSLYFTVH